MTEAEATWQAFSERLFDQNKFAIKLGLESMRVAFQEEGDPQRSAPAIVVGGTNGKGGTSARIAAILEAHGLVTGFYSSPHLIELRERFRVSGRPVSREVALRHGTAVLERWGDPESSEPCLTFFELTTLIASRVFDEMSVDVVVWEVGLGGRLDAVNAIEPSVTVISAVGMDHEKYLGETIEEIAAEKAALIRPDVPVVIGHQPFPAARHLLRRSAGDGMLVAPEKLPESDEPITTRRNRATAVAAARTFLEQAGIEYSEERANEALDSVVWWGRMEERRVVFDGAEQTIIVDAAHNPQGVESFFEWLRGREVGSFVFTAMKDKDLAGLTAPLARHRAPWVHARIRSERAADAIQLAPHVGRAPAVSASTTEALRRAFELAQGAPVAIFGSLYLLGEVYDALGFDADDFTTFAPR